MQFMALLKGSPETEARIPSQEEVAMMGKYIEAAMKAGWLLATGGLQSSAKAARITYTGGKSTVTDGPFTEAKELIASYAILQVNSKEEAIARTSEFLALIGGGEVDLWQLYEPADFRP
jgi:hypothetical protein